MNTYRLRLTYCDGSQAIVEVTASDKQSAVKIAWSLSDNISVVETL